MRPRALLSSYQPGTLGEQPGLTAASQVTAPGWPGTCKDQWVPLGRGDICDLQGLTVSGPHLAHHRHQWIFLERAHMAGCQIPRVVHLCLGPSCALSVPQCLAPTKHTPGLPSGAW